MHFVILPNEVSRKNVNFTNAHSTAYHFKTLLFCEQVMA